MNRPQVVLVIGALFLSSPCLAQTLPNGVSGSGVTDDTAAIQAALDAAGKTGGELFLPPGRYLIKGSLTVPTGVTLRGSWDEPHHGAWDKGTTLLLTGGRGEEDGTPAITLQQSSALKGFTLVWPEETADNIVPYPWAIHGTGMHNTVEDVTLVNAYQGIQIGPGFSELHEIRNVFGCVLRRGVFIDSTTDVGRLENIHFNTHYWMRSGYPTLQGGDPGRVVPAYTMSHLEAFIFGRTDWEYVLNTFVWGARYGYHFIGTRAGACNGQFLGIGADDCDVDVLVDSIQPMGLQITNGEFTAFVHPTSAAIVVSPGATGALQFVNCTFWATPGGAAQIHGNVQATFNACHFENAANPGLIVADNGALAVTSCSFASRGAAVVLQPGARSAVIMGNLQPGGLHVENGIADAAQMGLNQAPHAIPTSALSHYELKIGAPGSGGFMEDGWYGREDAPDGVAAFGPDVTTASWTNGDATLKLPVIPGKAYTLKMDYVTRPGTPPETLSVPGGPDFPIPVGRTDVLTVPIPASATAGQTSITVTIKGKPWQPSVLTPPATDNRELGVRVFAVEMQKEGATAPPVNITKFAD